MQRRKCELAHISDWKSTKFRVPTSGNASHSAAVRVTLTAMLDFDTILGLAENRNALTNAA